MAEHTGRKLAVILHADVVSSTALVQRHETLAHERIQDAFQRFSRTIQRFGGMTHELRGDALVAEFDKASDCLCAALVFQQENSEFNAMLDDDIQPQLRIGISLSEVVIADKTVTGTGVVLAQRLEQLAEPGGVCIQGAVYETVPKRFPFEYASLGEQEVKGFDEAVRVYKATLKPGEALPQPKSAGPAKHLTSQLPGKPSIAVLPFDDLSGDSGEDYFGDGIAEEIITALSKIREFHVIARNSSFAYKGQALNLRDVAAALDVRYVMEGSVRTAGERVRVTAQLIDAEEGHHVWAERYDRDRADILAVQDEIAERVVGAVEPELLSAEIRRAQDRPVDSLDAWGYTVRGRGQLIRFSQERSAEAKALLEKALAIDADYVPALAFLTYCHFIDVFFGWSQDPRASIGEALRLGRKAADIDNHNPWVPLVLGLCEFVSKQPDRAMIQFKKSIELNPNFAVGYGYLGLQSAYAGEVESAVAAAQRALRLSPHDPEVIHFHVALATAYFVAGRYDAAIENAQAAIRERWKVPAAHRVMVASYALLGKLEQAASARDDLIGLAPGITVSGIQKTIHFKDPKHSNRYADGLRRAGIPE